MTWSGRGVRQSRRRFIRRRLCPDVLGENTDHQPFINRSLVEDIGCDALDRVPQRQELRLPCDALGTFYASELIDGGVTDLALDGHVAVQHREPEREAFVVVSYYSVSRQRHRTASSKRQKENCEERARGAAILLMRQRVKNWPKPRPDSDQATPSSRWPCWRSSRRRLIGDRLQSLALRARRHACARPGKVAKEVR